MAQLSVDSISECSETERTWTGEIRKVAEPLFESHGRLMASHLLGLLPTGVDLLFHRGHRWTLREALHVAEAFGIRLRTRVVDHQDEDEK